MECQLVNPWAQTRWGKPWPATPTISRGHVGNHGRWLFKRPIVGFASAEMAFRGRSVALSRHHTPKCSYVLAATTESTSINFFVREAEENDINQVVGVVVEAFNTFGASAGQGGPFTDEQIGDIALLVRDLYFHPKKRVQVAVSMEDNGTETIIGVCGLSLEDPVAAVAVLAVATSSSGRGVGHALMRSIIDICDQETDNATMSLFVDSANPAAFALYSSVGFDVVDVCAFFEGYVSESVADVAMRKVEREGTIFRLMEERDVLQCDELYRCTVGQSRLNNILEMQRRTDPHPSIVAVKLTPTGVDRVVAYSTSYTVFGHSVATDEKHFVGLLSFASKLAESSGRGELMVQCRPRANPDIVKWALKSGLRLKGQMFWMTRGGCISVNPDFVYGAGVEY